MATIKKLPEHLHAVHDWTESAGELGALAALSGAELDDYVRESAENARQHDRSDVTESDLRELAAWLRPL